MSTWTVKILDSTSTYVDDGTIPRPNQDLETQTTSNTQVIGLADGSTVLITPEIKKKVDPITMFFADTTSALRSKIESYMTNGDSVQIITHTGEIFTGMFISMKRVWFVGIADTYDIMVTFLREYNSD